MSRLVFGLTAGLKPSEVIRRGEIAAAFEIEHAHEVQADGLSVGYFYTDSPKGSPHDDLLIQRLFTALEGKALEVVEGVVRCL